MKRQIQITEDGSVTVALAGSNITYHSKHGAIQESKHVFIKTGLEFILQQGQIQKNPVCIFEMGFGTGLNALLTLDYALQHQQPVYYYTVELNPLTPQEIQQLNYTTIMKCQELEPMFKLMHACAWEEDIVIHPLFILHKTNQSLTQLSFANKHKHLFHLVYYDAFAPEVQPELWTRNIFDYMYHILHPNGILTTYCCKGIVRRAMMAAGFTVTKVPGPPGKREILRIEKKL